MEIPRSLLISFDEEVQKLVEAHSRSKGEYISEIGSMMRGKEKEVNG